MYLVCTLRLPSGDHPSGGVERQGCRLLWDRCLRADRPFWWYKYRPAGRTISLHTSTTRYTLAPRERITAREGLRQESWTPLGYAPFHTSLRFALVLYSICSSMLWLMLIRRGFYWVHHVHKLLNSQLEPLIKIKGEKKKLRYMDRWNTAEKGVSRRIIRSAANVSPLL